MVKKKILLRIDQGLHKSLQKWANDDLRSLNAQIEYILRNSSISNGRMKKSEVFDDYKLEIMEG